MSKTAKRKNKVFSPNIVMKLESALSITSSKFISVSIREYQSNKAKKIITKLATIKVLYIFINFIFEEYLLHFNNRTITLKYQKD